MSLSADVWATVLGGNATYGDLKPGDRFSFPKRTDVLYEKGLGGWYTRVPGAHLAYPRPKYRTGSKAAVVRVELTNSPVV